MDSVHWPVSMVDHLISVSIQDRQRSERRSCGNLFQLENSSDDDEGEFLLESFKPSFTCLLTKSAEGVDVRLHHNMVFSET